MAGTDVLVVALAPWSAAAVDATASERVLPALLG
jgi:hypothetical protein